MSNINLDNVYCLFIMIPLAVLFSIPFALAIRKENANLHNITSQVLHILMAVIIAFAAAGTSIQTIMTETNIYVVADVSYSTDKNLDTIDSYIANLDLPINSKVGLVCFGKDCEIVSNMGNPNDLKSVKEATVDTSETDIAGALEFTGELFREDVIKRIVLITDGKETDESDSYAMTRAVDSLESRKIRVDAIYLNDNIKENAKEVQISSARFTNVAYINSSEKAVLNIDTTYNTLAVMSIERNGENISNHAISLDSGTNSIDIDLVTDVAGEYDYKITVKADGDECEYNNAYTFSQTVTDVMNVLIVAGKEYTSLESVIDNYPDGVKFDVFINGKPSSLTETDAYWAFDDFLERYENDPDVRINLSKLSSDMTFPNSLEEICKYDVIILAEEDFGGMPTFIKNVEIAVSQFGKSLITLGNLHLQTSTSESSKLLGEMLPVQYGNDDSAPKIFTIVIDTSYSMLFTTTDVSRFEVAKTVAKKLLDTLNDGDEVCIISFSAKVRMVQAPTALNEGTRAAIASVIDKLTMAQGSDIGGGLKMAYDYMIDLNNSEKQVMLISDGESFMAGSDSPTQVAADMYEAGIYTSVFDVNEDRRRPGISGLRYIAQAGCGNTGADNYFYNKGDLWYVDSVTFAQITDSINKNYFEEETPVSVARYTDDLLDGSIDPASIPDISGFVVASVKPSAMTVLTLDHKEGETVKKYPLYAYWKYGNGTVATLTSKRGDRSCLWMKTWENSGFVDIFFKSMLRVTLPKEKTLVPYTTQIERKGNVSEVVVMPAEENSDAVSVITVTMPDGDTFNRRLSPAGGYFTCQFESSMPGKYIVDIDYNVDGKIYRDTKIFYYSYSPEYDAFEMYDPSALYQALNGRGNVSLNGKLSLENEDNTVEMYKIDLTMPLMIAVLALYVIDVAVRKLKWEDIKSFFGFAGKNKAKKSGGKQQ